MQCQCEYQQNRGQRSHSELTVTQVARWAVICCLDVVSELVLLAVPIWFISKNQIKNSKKRVVVFVYTFRLVVAAFSIATVSTYFSYLHDSKLSIGAGPTIAWQEVLLGTSLVSASIPCLRSFLWAFMSTGLMTVYGNNGTTTGGSAVLPSLNRSQVQESHSRSTNREEQQPSRSLQQRLRPDWQQYRADVKTSARDRVKSSGHARGAESGSLKSDASEQMIIHHNVEFGIESS